MKRKNNHGFSVVELMITLGLIAALTVMAFKFSKAATARAGFTATLNQFVSDYSYARQLASRTNRYVAIVFATDGTHYDIMTQNRTGNLEDFTLHRRVTSKIDDQFFNLEDVESFTINSMGMVRDYPITALSTIRSFDLELFQKLPNTENYLFKRKIHIFPTGGLKVRSNTWDAEQQMDFQ